MSVSHGKKTVLIIDGHDISTYCDNSSLEAGKAEHDVTCYGADDVVVAGGLRNGKVSFGGKYDTSRTAGPKAVLEPIIDDTTGATVTLIRRGEGTGSGKPQESVAILVTKYVETNPVGDYVSWTAEGTKSGPITRTTQP
jgi:hypothetical protein